MLLQIDAFRWLDEPAGWFTIQGIAKHGLPKAIDKVLAVAGDVSATMLCQALSRNRRLWKEPLPEKVLLEYCRLMPNVRIEGDRIRSDPRRNWKKVLAGVEAKLIGVLKKHGPLLDRGAMEDLCVAAGMNRFSFHAFVSWSPVIEQFGHSLYGPVGASVTQEQVDDILAQRRTNRASQRVLRDHGLTDDGKVWLKYKLSKAASTYAVITIPAALKKIVRGRFKLLAPNGQDIGTLAAKDGRAWGLGAFLRRCGAKFGDQVTLTLDLPSRAATVSWKKTISSQTRNGWLVDDRWHGRAAGCEGRAVDAPFSNNYRQAANCFGRPHYSSFIPHTSSFSHETPARRRPMVGFAPLAGRRGRVRHDRSHLVRAARRDQSPASISRGLRNGGL